MSTRSAHDLARSIDISCVRANHTEQDIRWLADQARRWGCINAHVLPAWVPLLHELLQGSDTLVGAPVGFPSGGSASVVKVSEAVQLLNDGVQEMDVVMNVGRFLSGDIPYVERELRTILTEVAGTVPVKVILETSLLDDSGTRLAAQIAAEAGADFVKTGTGWAGPATVDAVRAIAESVPPHVRIKAAGGIRTLDALDHLRQAGATRFGLGAHAAVGVLREAEAETETGA